MNEETDGVVESVSKLQAKVKGLTGVDILTDTGAYKDTYTIIKEIAQVWEDMSDIDQAALLEMLAGKNRSNAMAAMLTNIEDLEGAYQDALNAEGSAMAENEKQLNSIQGRITLFKNAVQTMWSDALDSSWIKFFVNLGTAVVKAVDSFGLFKSVLAGVVSYLLISKKINPVTMFKEISANVSNYGQALEKIKAIQSLNGLGEAGKISAAEFNVQNLSAYAAAVSDLTAKQQAAALASAGLTKAQIEEAMAKNGVDKANIQQAVSEAQVTTAKTEQTTVTAANAAAMAAEGAVKLSAESTNWLLTQGETELTLAKVQEAVATGTLTAAQGAEIISAFGLTAANQGLSTSIHGVAAALKSLMASNPVGWILMAITLVISLVTWIANMTPASEKLKNEIQDLNNEIESLNSELETTKNRIEELEGKHNLSFVEKEELETLKQTNEELERRLRLLNESKDSKQKELQKETKEDYKKDFNVKNLSIEEVKTNKDDERYGNATIAKAEIENAKNNQIINDNLRNAIKPYSEKLYNMLADVSQWGELSDEAVAELLRVEAQISDELNGDLKYISDGSIDKEGYIQKGIEKYNELRQEWNELINTDTSAMSEDEKSALDSKKKSIESSIQNLKETLSTYGTELYDYLDNYGENVDDDFANKLKQMALDIDKTINPGEYYTEQFDALLEKYPEVKKKLYSLAETGELTADSLNGSDYSEFRNELNKIGLSTQDAVDQINSLGSAAAHAELNKVDPVGSTFSNYADEIDKVTSAQSVQNEVVYDKIKLTDEQGEALKALIGNEKEYADAIDTTNGYVVKDASLLNKLITKMRQEAAQNARTERSQARLKYYELYKKIKQLTGANGELAQANAKEINALYKEMGAVERTIAKYSLLEQKLLGAADAYQKYEDAKSADEAKDYGSKAEDMISGLIEGLQSAKLGTESFKAAVAGMIPEDVYAGFDTVEEKVAAIANYLKNSDFSKYFTLKFSDDGTLESAEMTLDNVQAFIESAQEKGVFTNKGDWQHFELSSDIKTLDDFCDKMKITKEMAFAMFTEIDSYDAEWLNGDFGSVFDQLDLGLEGNIFMATKNLAELDVALANNEIGVEEWAQKYQEANSKLQGCAEDARKNAVEYQNVTKEVTNLKDEVEQATKKLNEMNQPNSGYTQEEINAQTKKVKELTEQLGEALKKKYNLEEPTEVSIQLALDDIDSQMAVWKANNNELAVKANIANIDDSKLVELGEDGKYKIKPDVEITDDERQKLQQYVDLLNDKGVINLLVENKEEAKAQIEEVKTAAEAAKKAIEALPDPSVDSTAAVKSINNLIDAIDRVPTGVTVTTTYREVNENQTATKHSGRRSRYELNSTMANGTAHASGNWGLPQAEDDALVGELGMETVVDPQTGKYYTVGDNGAEFVDLPKNAIIFNHKQTEELFKNGHINSRGKAYSEGNAHVTIVPDYTTPTYYSGAKNDNFWTDLNDAADSLSDAGDDLSDAANDFEEMFDWFAVLLEEIDDDLNYMSAALENAVGISAKNDIQDQMINVNKYKLTELGEGYKLYADYAAQLLKKIPQQYQELAKNGGVALTEFLGEANQEVVEAINNYREWAQKASDVRTQQQQVKKEITSLSLQKVQTIADEYDRVITKITTLNDLLQANVDLIDEQGERTSAVMYEEMIKNSIKELDELQKKRNDMQKEFDAQVSAGNIDVGSEEWYEGIAAIQDVDKAIIDCRKEIEGFQNSINQLHWDNFDGLIKAIDNVGNEISNLGDLIDDEDIADEMGNWTNEGITKMGLLAQEMERAQYRAKQYAEQIEYLNQEYAAGKYSTDEYNEKLQELKDGQWDSIKSYEAAKDAIIELNKTRIESVKDGINKELEAYQKLIDTKKKELQLSKD